MFQKKRILAAGLALVLAFSLTACNGKNADGNSGQKNAGSNAEELAPEFSYVAKYQELPENFNMGEIVFNGNNAYSAKTDYTNGSSLKIVKTTIENGNLGQENTLFELQDFSLNGFAVDSSDNVYMINAVYPQMDEEAPMDNFAYENSAKNYLVKYNASGEKVFETDLSDATKDLDFFYPQHFMADDQGRTYVYCYQLGILLFDQEGKFVGTVDFPSQNGWINAMGTAKDGKIYASYVNYGQDGSESCLAEVDFDGKKLGTPHKNFPCNNGNVRFTRGKDCDVLCFDQSGLYEYSIEKEESNKLLTWLDIDVQGDYLNQLSVTEDGKPCVILNDYAEEKTNLIFLEKVRTEEIAKRTILTVGTLYEDSSLTRKILQFNKSNNQYRIKIKTYLDVNNWSDTSYDDAIANLTNDISSGNVPDILDLTGLDIDNLISKGVLEDLAPYLEKSTKLDKNDFFDRILEEATYNGVLAYVSSGFTLETLVGKSSLVGNKMGWTIADMIKLHEQYPDAELLEYADRETILQIMLMLDKAAFIDTQKAECHFDSEQFKNLLAFAKSFPQEYDYSNQSLSPIKLKNNSLLLVSASIYDFSEIQSVDAYFDGEACTYVGYPIQGGGNGCILSPRETYGISAKSANKDAAWAFLENMITERDEDFDFGFSSLKSNFEEQKKEALDVKYVYDEDGNIMKDEFGNPVYEGGGSGYTMVGDDGQEWRYTYRPVTAEEVDLVERLLEGAVVVNTSMDEELNKIINEEAQGYFQGSKSVDDVANVIQNRVNLYLKENN